MKPEPSAFTLPARHARMLFCLALTALAFSTLALRTLAADYTVTTTGNVIVVSDISGNADTLALSEPSAGNIRFTAAGRTFSVNGGAPIAGDSGVLSLGGVTQITVNAGAGADTLNVGAFAGTLPSLTLNGGTGDDTINFNGDITFATGASLDVDLQNDNGTPGADAVNVSGNVLVSGTGSITVRCSRNVAVNSGARLQTVNGNLTVEANQQAVPTTGNFAGITVGGGLVRCTGTGQVVVRGRGGDDAGGGQLGVLVVNAGQIIGSTSGGLTVMGTGGASTNWVNRGVTVYGSNALVSSLGGPVQVTGQSGSVGSYYGIGISILYGGVISAGGMGTLSVTGIGAGGGHANHGIEQSEPGSAITSAGGAIEVTGTAGPGNSSGISVANQAGIINTNVGNSVSLISDSIAFENNVNIVGGGVVTLKPKNNGTLINLGGADANGILGLTDAELDRITAGTLVIGAANAGSITLSAPLSPAGAAAFNLVSGGAIADTYAGGPDVTVANLSTSGNLAPGASPGLFSVAGNVILTANSTYTVEIGGTNAGTQHDQLSATGSVTLGANVTLNVLAFGGFVPAIGQSFTILSRTGGSGNFAGLPPGTILVNFLGSGLNATLTYAGGTGDDVVITMDNPALPFIVAQPAGTNAPPGANITLCVTATASPPPTYQWRRNGVNIPGANASCFTITGAAAQNGGTYDVVVYNGYGAALSGPATVVITVPSLPPGDNFANRVRLPASNGTVRASNLNATREVGEPVHVGKPGGASVWYSFTSAAAGVMLIDTAGSTIDTLLAVYTGTNVPSLVEITGDEETGGALTSQVRFNVRTNVEYCIVVDGYGGVMGEFVLSWNFQPTADAYPVLLNQPLNVTVAPGVNHTFAVAVTGSNLIYQWYFNDSPISGATTNAFTVTNVQANSVGTYSLVVTQGTRWVSTRPANLQINITGASSQPVQAADKFLDASLLSAPIQLGDPGGPFLPFSPAALSRGYSGAQIFNTHGTASATDEPPICGVRGGATEWIQILAEQTGELYLNTDGSSFDTVLAVFDRISGVTGLHYLGCDNNSGLDGFDSALVIPVTAGKTNYVMIDGVNGTTGVLRLNYNLVVPSALTPLGRNLLGQYQFQITGRPGMSFTVQYTSDFTIWATLYSGTDADGSALFTDTSPPPPGGRFYRLLMRP